MMLVVPPDLNKLEETRPTGLHVRQSTLGTADWTFQRKFALLDSMCDSPHGEQLIRPVRGNSPYWTPCATIHTRIADWTDP